MLPPVGIVACEGCNERPPLDDRKTSAVAGGCRFPFATIWILPAPEASRDGALNRPSTPWEGPGPVHVTGTLAVKSCDCDGIKVTTGGLIRTLPGWQVGQSF